MCSRGANDIRSRLELHLVRDDRLTKPHDCVVCVPRGATYQPEQPLLRPADERVTEDVERRESRPKHLVDLAYLAREHHEHIKHESVATLVIRKFEQ